MNPLKDRLWDKIWSLQSQTWRIEVMRFKSEFTLTPESVDLTPQLQAQMRKDDYDLNGE